MNSPQNEPIVEHPDVASGIRFLEAWIEARMATTGLPGVSIGIVYDQDLIWARGFGCRDVERKFPAAPETVYRIASISKLFTSTAILQLRDEGKLGLDDPVSRYLSWFQIRNPFPDALEVTVRHLLTHTAGLPREAGFPYWTDFKFPTREELVEKLPEQELAYPPETRFKYSNLGLSLAGEIVEAVSGEAYARYIHGRILEPLGMDSTSVSLPDAHRERLAVGYGRRALDGTREVMPFTDAKAIAPAANLSTTVEDLARFASLQFRDGKAGGKQILKGSTLREMHRVDWLFPDWSGGRGLGFVVYRKGERTLVGHGGHVAGSRTQVAVCPAEKVGVVALTNASDGDPMAFVDQAFRCVAPAVGKAAAPVSERVAFDPGWEAYVGKYRNAWADTQVLVVRDALALISPAEADPEGTMYHLIPAGEHTFRMEGKDGNGPVGELAVFEMGADGRVVRLKVGENETYPHDAY